MNSVFCLETREKIGQDMGFGEARQGGVLQGFSQHSNFFQSSLQSPSEKKIYTNLCTEHRLRLVKVRVSEIAFLLPILNVELSPVDSVLNESF